jgi:hypothetical protein
MLMYGSKNCALHRSERRKTGAAEMCFIRHVPGCSLANRVRSKTIRDASEICALEERFRNYNNNLTNHIFRAVSSKLPPKVNNYQPDGRRNFGRPRR